MTAVWTNETKDSSTFTNQSVSGIAIWGDIVATWGDVLYAWGDGRATWTDDVKNTSTFTNQVKN